MEEDAEGKQRKEEAKERINRRIAEEMERQLKRDEGEGQPDNGQGDARDGDVAPYTGAGGSHSQATATDAGNGETERAIGAQTGPQGGAPEGAGDLDKNISFSKGVSLLKVQEITNHQS